MQPTSVSNARSAMPLLTAVLCLAMPPSGLSNTFATAGFTLASADLTPGGAAGLRQVYDRDGCRGRNVSPALSWAQPPAGARSFALLMFDPDAPGGIWWHWLVFDIPARTRSLPAGAGDPRGHLMPRGAIQSRNDFGSSGYGGPCPPPGAAHHYHLVIYALRVARLGLSANATPGEVASRVRTAAIAKAEMTVLYGR